MFEQLRIKSDFVKAVMVLTSGTVIAQVISYGVTPLLTRLFTPEEFGELGVYMRITAFLAAIGAARYEYTLPLPKSEQHAFHLYRLSLRITKITLGLTFLIGLSFWFIQGTKWETFWMIIAVLGGTYFMLFKNLGSNWSIRTNNYSQISKSTIMGSFTANGLKILAGLTHLGSLGLILATMIGAGAGVILFIREFLSLKKQPSFQKSDRKMRVLSKKYSDFPKVNLPHMLVDHGRELLIALFMVELLDQAIFGSYDHSFRMLKVPLALIGVSIGQVFYTKLAKAYTAKEDLRPIVVKTALSLFLIAAVPFTIIFFYGGPIFMFVFGEKWAFSGEIAAILSPWLLVNFVASPLSTIPLVIGKQKAFFWVAGIGSLLQILSFGLLPHYIASGELTVHSFFWIISLSMTIYFTFVVFWKIWLVGR